MADGSGLTKPLPAPPQPASPALASHLRACVAIDCEMVSVRRAARRPPPGASHPLPAEAWPQPFPSPSPAAPQAPRPRRLRRRLRSRVPRRRRGVRPPGLPRAAGPPRRGLPDRVHRRAPGLRAAPAAAWGASAPGAGVLGSEREGTRARAVPGASASAGLEEGSLDGAPGLAEVVAQVERILGGATAVGSPAARRVPSASATAVPPRLLKASCAIVHSAAALTFPALLFPPSQATSGAAARPRLLIGHSVHNDLEVLGISHPQARARHLSFCTPLE